MLSAILFVKCARALYSYNHLQSDQELHATEWWRVSGRYIDMVMGVDRKHCIRKHQCLHVVVGVNEEDCLETLYLYKLPDDQWIDDVTKWPPVNFPSLYMYSLKHQESLLVRNVRLSRALKLTTITKGECAHIQQ